MEHVKSIHVKSFKIFKRKYATTIHPIWKNKIQTGTLKRDLLSAMMSRANLWSRSLADAMSIINLMSFRPNWYVSLLGSCEGNKMKIMWETEKRKIDRERERVRGREG